uniref:WASH-7_N domain-containing protein n=1 Tax=Macrostomum lignano TaxID=282301 RepID=A0A1I8FF36_9PLAT
TRRVHQQEEAGAKNSARLFCRSFNFAGLDGLTRRCAITWRRSACRGEAPLIQHVLEHFARPLAQRQRHPFANEDARYAAGDTRAVGPGPVQPNLGPTVAALSHVFDKTADEAIVVPKAISDVFDNIIISLCKFTGLLSSVETLASSRAALSEELAARQRAAECIRECQLEQLVQDTKFLRMDSLSELVKDLNLCRAGQLPVQGPAVRRAQLRCSLDEETPACFTLNCSCRCCLQNRDRLGPLWSSVRALLLQCIDWQHRVLLPAGALHCGPDPAGHRLLHREDMSAQVFQFLLRLLIPGQAVNPARPVCRQVGAQPMQADWRILFALCWRSAAAGAPAVSRLPGLRSPPTPARGLRASGSAAAEIGVEAATAEHRRPQPTPTDQSAAALHTRSRTPPSCTTLTSRVGSGGGSGGDRDVRMGWTAKHGQLGAGGPRQCPASAQDVSRPASSAGSSAGATCGGCGNGGCWHRRVRRPAIGQQPSWFTQQSLCKRTASHHDTKALVRACEISHLALSSGDIGPTSRPANFESCIHALARLHRGLAARRPGAGAASFRSQLHHQR